VKAAAAELGVSEAAVSLHVGHLRKELGDQLFVRTGSGIAFTPGGLRLASRAVQMLGLQDRTVQEVRQAGGVGRLLRVGVSGLFAEYAAPGLIEAFTQRAADLEVELRTDRTSRFDSLLVTRTIDVAVGPRVQLAGPELSTSHFLNYGVVAVVAPGHAAASGQAQLPMLREQTWLLGPSASERGGIVTEMLARLAVPEQQQRIFQSHAAALEEVKRGRGIALTVDFAVAADVEDGSLVVLPGPLLRGRGEWSLATLSGERASPAAAELRRFVVTPRATQAMLRRRGAGVGRFRPAVHVTLWS